MVHGGSGEFLDKVTFFVPGELPSSCPVRTGLGISVLANGVATEWTEMCVSREA